MQGKAKILIVTAVWGEWHVNAHLTANLPTLLAAENFPELARRCDLIYHVYTRQSDLSRIRSSPCMQEISRMMSVEFKIISLETCSSDPIAAHHWVWEQARVNAKESGWFVLFLPPDVAWANGSFAHVANLLAAGKKAIFMTYLRVVSETFVPALQEHRESASETVAMTGRSMVELSLSHMHPLQAAYCYDSPYFPMHAEMIVWPIRGEGLLVRVLAREIFLCDPGRVGMKRNWLMDENHDPREMAFVDDSDKLFAVSLAPLGKDVSWHMGHLKATPLTLARWWLKYDSPCNDFVASARICWHTGRQTARLWQQQKRRSDHLILNAIAAREGLRVWRELNMMKCRMAASLLGLITGVGLLMKVSHAPSPAVIFVPTDAALQQLASEAMNSLMVPGNVRRLIAFLRHHVVFDADASLCERLRGESSVALMPKTAAGYSLSIERFGSRLTVNGFEVLEPGRRVGRYMVYSVNGVLAPTMGQ